MLITPSVGLRVLLPLDSPETGDNEPWSILLRQRVVTSETLLRQRVATSEPCFIRPPPHAVPAKGAAFGAGVWASTPMIPGDISVCHASIALGQYLCLLLPTRSSPVRLSPTCRSPLWGIFPAASGYLLRKEAFPNPCWFNYIITPGHRQGGKDTVALSEWHGTDSCLLSAGHCCNYFYKSCQRLLIHPVECVFTLLGSVSTLQQEVGRRRQRESR